MSNWNNDRSIEVLLGMGLLLLLCCASLYTLSGVWTEALVDEASGGAVLASTARLVFSLSATLIVAPVVYVIGRALAAAASSFGRSVAPAVQV